MPGTAPSSAGNARSSSAARTARTASSPRADGAPNTAIRPSPKCRWYSAPCRRRISRERATRGSFVPPVCSGPLESVGCRREGRLANSTVTMRSSSAAGSSISAGRPVAGAPERAASASASSSADQ